ncbi:uncharacterized protein LOC103356733 [Stegastes partitus]|uniref:Uncharacterized protein LOC103356733 n=1 Tax=Stegastes partitus TaxID=144197 RepID=A0A9Y4MZD7_9TELE|nr:PREDICTED: uncharacterized protein LOC103356733 [Stegastes partitus]
MVVVPGVLGHVTVKAGRARGPAKAKPSPAEVDDEEHEETKPKPVPARYKRGPPLPKPQSQQKKEVLPAVRRSERLQAGPVHSYNEEDSEEEDEEDEVRPRPIPARYLRGPPKSPEGQPKQKTKCEWTGRKTDDLTVTSGRREWLYMQRRKPEWANCDIKSPAHMDYTERWDERLLHEQQSYSQQRYKHRDSTGQDTGPSQTRGLMSCFVVLGAFLLVVAILVHLN